ncbi:nucleoside phosphorylase [Halorussus sp. MSC15.2]|uniref:nucleoside phosphorylase n=1 Tax=Halorussus sp. MSC15.2 TaxID=2283638 RepID=UPI0013D05943|nr:nucleoside phosphorylase [Halorussus sp. MSC15.2]NEU59102.1 nucleoside phosphorylase [Halorussus sp. MSC15.2]
MPIPNFGDKYDAEALFSPAEAVGEQDDGLPDVPPAVILGFQDVLYEEVAERTDDTVNVVRGQTVHLLNDDVGFIGDFGIGAPVTATITENLLAAGAEVVCILGGCGCLQRSIPPNDAILPTRAIRDEGVSYHYLPPDEEVRATPELVDALDASLSDAGVETHRGPTWTTSAYYRETVPEIDRYAEEGVVSLGMETAAMLAVAEYRDADAAVVHEIGDHLTPDEWESGVEREENLAEFLDPTVEALRRYVVSD